MAIATASAALPARAGWRRLSLWVWLLLGLAALYAATEFAAAGSVASALFGAAPLFLAAALMAVAPRQRLTGLAAFCFAYGPTVILMQEAFTQDLHDILRMSASGYYALQDLIIPAVATLRGLSGALGLIAVVALALYLGRVSSRRGWWIVAIGLVLAVIHAATNVATLAPLLSFYFDNPDAGFDLVPTFFGTGISALMLIAWAYLTAVALDRRVTWLLAAGVIRLVQTALGLLSFAYLQLNPPTGPNDTDPLNSAINIGLFILGVAFWGALIYGVLTEFARSRSQGAISAA